MDTSNWTVSGDSVDELCSQMRKLLDNSGKYVMDLVHKFDVDANAEVSSSW